MTDERTDIDTFALEEPTETETAEAEADAALTAEAPAGDAAPEAESLEAGEDEVRGTDVEDDAGIAWADPAGDRDAWAESDWVEDAPQAPEEAAVQVTEDLPPEMSQPSESESEAALSEAPVDVDPSETAEPVAAEGPSVDPARQIEEAPDPEAAARAALGLEGRVEDEELAPEDAAAILKVEEEIVEEAVVDLDDADLLDVFDEQDTEPSPYDRPGSWYVVHTYSGYEKKVKSNLESRIKSLNMEDRIHEIVIPMDDVIEFKGGKKTVVQKKVFPGYLLVRMRLDDDSWGAVRNTPGVTGFVGSGAKPVPLSRKEVESILRVRPEGEQKKARPRLEYEVGDQVRVTAGPFADFNGIIDEINVDQNTLKVLVNIFGRETPVTLDFADVAKL